MSTSLFDNSGVAPTTQDRGTNFAVRKQAEGHAVVSSAAAQDHVGAVEHGPLQPRIERLRLSRIARREARHALPQHQLGMVERTLETEQPCIPAQRWMPL
jgi:hypothetical protein